MLFKQNQVTKPTSIAKTQWSEASLIVQVVDIFDKIIHRAAARTVIPPSTIANTSSFACQSDCTASRDIVRLASFDAGSEQVDTFSFIADTRIQLLEVETMFHCAAFNQVSLRYIWVVGNHTIGIPQPKLYVGIDFDSAKKDDISEAFTGSVFTRDSIGVGVNA